MSSVVVRFARPALAVASVLLATLSIAARLDAQDGGASAPVPADPARIEKGRELFAIWGCGSCHALNDADATGHVGPGFDHNPGLSQTLIVDRVTNGQGPMPAFGGQMTDQEISDLATYISQVANK